MGEAYTFNVPKQESYDQANVYISASGINSNNNKMSYLNFKGGATSRSNVYNVLIITLQQV